MSSTIRPDAPTGFDPQPFAPIIAAYRDSLMRTGLTERSVSQHQGPARHLLVWLDETGIGLDRVDGDALWRFFHHDCTCKLPHPMHSRRVGRARGFVTRISRFVCFLEETGRISTPGECDANLRLLETFLNRLVADGYRPRTIRQYGTACRHFIVWLHHFRIPVAAMDADVVDRFLHHECMCALPGVFRGRVDHIHFSSYAGRIKQFAAFLARRGLAPDAVSSDEKPDDGLEDFRVWLRQHRGIGDRSIRRHARTVAALLPDLGDRPDRYDAVPIRDALLRRAGTVSRHQAKQATSSLRMYLRFLASNGRCRPALIGAVPTVPEWPLSTLPRYLSPEEVERAIASCDPATAKGLRDRAILLLLARLALRAGDVAGLRLGDIDWERALLRVCGKSGQETALPLPQDVGDTVLDYIMNARPRGDEEKVFLRAVAPHRSFSNSGAITTIARAALDRAGIVRASFRGAQVFRHAAATNLLRSGASLEVVGALLRHQSPKTTAIYAKVDLDMLAKVAQPWIGGDVPCR